MPISSEGSDTIIKLKAISKTLMAFLLEYLI